MMRRPVLALALLSAATVSAQVYQPATCKNAFTRDQEISEGQKVVAEVYKQMPVLPDSDPATQYVRRIGEKLVAAAPLTPGMEQPWPFRFHVVADKEINAFALPGGTMFVNLGAIQAAETEAQLAGVMGHEMSHVILRHSTCNLTKQRKKSLGYGILAIGSAIALGDSGFGALAQKGIGFGASLDFLHMSREDEQQADLLGAQIVYNANYDPRGLPQFFEIITAKYGSGGAQFLSDHPNPGNRTTYINAEIAAMPPLQHPVVNTDGFRQMKARAATLPVYDATQMKQGAWRGTGLYSSGPDAPAGRMGPPPPDGAAPAQNAPQQQTPQQPAPATIAPLTGAQIGLGEPLKRYQAQFWSILMPGSWTNSVASGGNVILAPPAGNGSFGLAYGVLAGVVKQPGNGVSDAATLQTATDTFISVLERNNALTTTKAFRATKLGAATAGVVELTGQSPVAVNGVAQPEHDYLITIARNDGDMSFFLFVCPEPDFAKFKPLIDRMAAGIRAQ